MRFWPPLLALLTIGLPDEAGSVDLNTWGNIEFIVRYLDLEQQGSQTVGQTNIELSGETFIWRPWFARFEGTIRLGLLDASGDQADRSATQTGGSVRLRWFPESPFPGSLFIEQRQNAVDGIEDDDFDFATGTIELKQGYRMDNGVRLALSYREVERDENAQRVGNLAVSTGDETLVLTADYDLPRHQFRYRTQFQTLTSRNLGQQDQRDRHLLDHRYRHGSDLSVQSTLSFVSDEVEREGGRNGIETLQLNSFAFYRPNFPRPTRFSANLLLQDQTSESIGFSRDFQSANFLLAANTQWNERLNLSAGASIFDRQSDGSSSTQTRQSIGADYRQALPFLDQFNPNWEAFARIRAEQVDQVDVEDELETTLGTGVSMQWQVPLDWLSSSISASHRVSRVDGVERQFDEYVSRITFNGNRDLGNGSANTSIFLADNRRDGATDLSESSILGINGGYRHRLGRTESLSFDLGYQRAGGNDFNGSPLADSQSFSVSFGYRNQDLFGIPRLTFLSELRYFSQDLQEFLRPESELVDNLQNRSTWRNRLEYRIGMLHLLGQADLVNVEGETDLFLVFRARRNLGQLF